MRPATIIAAPVFFKSRRVHFARYMKWIQRMTHVPDVTNLPEIVRAEQERRGEPGYRAHALRYVVGGECGLGDGRAELTLSASGWTGFTRRCR